MKKSFLVRQKKQRVKYNFREKRPQWEKTKWWSKPFSPGCQCDWCSLVCSSALQHDPDSRLLISLCPLWLCVLSSIWQDTSANFQPSATGLAQQAVSLPQWDIMDSHQEESNEAAILGSPVCENFCQVSGTTNNRCRVVVVLFFLFIFEQRLLWWHTLTVLRRKGETVHPAFCN